MKKRKPKMVKLKGKRTVEEGKLPDNKATGKGFMKSEAQRFVKSGSTGGSSKEMDSYANKRLGQLARNRRQNAR